jgi:hypothetical protein
MTTENVKSILALLIANYSNSFKNVEKKDMELIIKTWETQFKSYTLDEVFNAIMSIIGNDTSNFAPSIGRVKDELNKKFKESVMPSEEAWSIVLNKASCNPIKARTNFEALPGNIKKAVKHPKFLESLGNANIQNQGTFKKDFVKSYKETIENDYQEMNANSITRLEFCKRNAIPGETIKALNGVADLKQIESK